MVIVCWGELRYHSEYQARALFLQWDGKCSLASHSRGCQARCPTHGTFVNTSATHPVLREPQKIWAPVLGSKDLNMIQP